MGGGTSVIPAAGLGTRMAHFNRPKISLPVGIRSYPLIYLFKRYLQAQTVVRTYKNIVVISSVALEYLESHRMSYPEFFSYVIDDEAKGTLSSLQHALPFLDADKIVVFNGDTIPLEVIPLHAAYSQYVMAVSPYDQKLNYDLVVPDYSNEMLSLVLHRSSAYMNVGAYGFGGGALQALAGSSAETVEGFLSEVSMVGSKVYLWKMSRPAIDVGNPAAYDTTEFTGWKDLYKFLDLDTKEIS